MESPLFDRTPAERRAIIETLRAALKREPGVLYAYVHGSLLEPRPFHDIDVAVWVDGVPDDQLTDWTIGLSLALSRTLGLPVDVRALNHAPLGFRYHVFQGQILCSRDDVARADCVERTMLEYLDIQPLRDRALKEAMRTWT